MEQGRSGIGRGPPLSWTTEPTGDGTSWVGAENQACSHCAEKKKVEGERDRINCRLEILRMTKDSGRSLDEAQSKVASKN